MVKEKTVNMRIGKCCKCGTSDCEETETLFKCEHIEIVMCVCVHCNSEFITYKLKCSVSNMLQGIIEDA